MKNSSAGVVDNVRRYESYVYASIWLLSLVLPFFNEFMRVAGGADFVWRHIIRWWVGIIPFLIVFLLNNILLIPRYLLVGRIRHYLLSLILVVSLFFAFQYATYESKAKVFRDDVERLAEPAEHAVPVKSRYTFMGIPMPVVMNLSLLLVLLGTNTAISFVFRYIKEREIRESLEKIRLQDEVRFLKAQINPHFFMNMLNNIHAMIELHPDTAQDMTIELSRLMRYVLYEGDNLTTTLADETRFISSYVNMLRRRYPENRVEIVLDMTSDIESKDFIVPPLLFVTFVENAFKHGISYKKKSSVRITFSLDDGKLLFRCFNTLHSHVEGQEGGIGLENAKRRLDLMYGDKYQLDIVEAGDNFTVELIIPGL
jgi:hypothetical protein